MKAITRVINKAMHAAAIITAAVAITTITACTADDNNPAAPVNPADAVSITTMVHKADTRATSAYAPEGATLTLLYGSMSAAADATAAYTCNADGAWITDKPLYWNDLDAIAAEYPFFAASPAVPVATPAVPTDQSTPELYTSADQLIAYAATSERRTAVPLTLHHVLSQITVKIVSATSADGTPDIPAAAISAATLQIAGAKAAYTMTYNAGAPAPATATAKADAPAVTINPRKAVAATTAFHSIVPPQTIAAGTLKLTFTIAGETYTWTNPEEISITAAVNHLISITAKKSAALLGTVDIVSWTETALIDDQVKLDDIANGATIALPTTTTGKFYLATTEDNTATEDNTEDKISIVALYNWNGAALTAATDPLAWDKLKRQPHTFRATFDPATAAATNHEKDYLTAIANDVAFGAALTFSAMTHANAQLSVKVTYNGQPLTTAQLAATTVKVNVNKTSSCNTSGEITLAAASKEVALNTNTTTTAPDAETITATAILAPQALTSTTDAPAIVINIGDKAYRLTKTVTLAAGKHTVVTANIVASEVGITIAVAQWADNEFDNGDVEIDK